MRRDCLTRHTSVCCETKKELGIRTLTRRIEDDASTSPCQGEAILKKEVRTEKTKKKGAAIRPPLSTHLVAELSDHFEFPFSFTLIGFLWVGSSLENDSLSLVVPFLFGAKVTVTVTDDDGWTGNELLSTANGG